MRRSGKDTASGRGIRGSRTKAPESLTCVDLFCGAGGFSEGFHQAGFRTIAANDSDPWAGATFELNHSRRGTKFVLGDIGAPETKEALLDAAAGVEVDALIGGPPCQAFSQVQNHARVIDDPRNTLYRHYVAMIAAVRPRVFVMENVPGLENLAGGLIRQQILEDLGLEGAYRVASKVVDAASFGVPQNRLRVLFVGVRADLKIEPRFPQSPWTGELPALNRFASRTERYSCSYRHAPSLLNRTALDELLDSEKSGLVTVEQAISDLTFLKPSTVLVRRPSDEPAEYEAEPQSAFQRARRARSKALLNADVPSIREDTVARLLAIPPGGNFRDMPPELAARYLSDKKWGPELGRANLSRKYFFAYRKLHPRHFSWTLNTKADCVFHYAKPRALSVREFARLHSFDDTYHFLAGDRHSRYRQVGNAVPPLLGKAIGETVRSILLQHGCESAGQVQAAAE